MDNESDQYGQTYSQKDKDKRRPVTDMHAFTTGRSTTVFCECVISHNLKQRWRLEPSNHDQQRFVVHPDAVELGK